METTAKVISGGGLIVRIDIKSLLASSVVSYKGIKWLKLNSGVTSEALEKVFDFGSDLTSGLIEIKIPRSSLESEDPQRPEDGVEIEISVGSSEVDPDSDGTYIYTYYTIDNSYEVSYNGFVTHVPDGAWGLAIIKY